MSFGRDFFDLPVYRLVEDEYYSQRDRYIEKVLFPPDSPDSAVLREKDRKNPSLNIAIRDHLAHSYGGSWRYNEIIGYIRLHFLGSQIRGEYFGVRKKRIVRSRTKTFEYKTWKLVPEIDIPANTTSSEIYQLILEYIADCRKELRNRYIDSSLFELLGPWVDWRGLYRSKE